MTATPIDRQPKGIATGGQFAATSRPEPSLNLGRHTAATSNRHVPESLRMAHFQNPRQVTDLEWEVENTIGVAGANLDYRCESFADLVPHLQSGGSLQLLQPGS